MTDITELETGLQELKRIRDKEKIKWNEDRNQWKIEQQRLHHQTQALESQLARLQSNHTDEVSTRDEQVDQLRSENAALAAHRDACLRDLSSLRVDLQDARKRFDSDKASWLMDRERIEAEIDRMVEQLEREKSEREREREKIRADVGLVFRGMCEIKRLVPAVIKGPAMSEAMSQRWLSPPAQNSDEPLPPDEWNELISRVLDQVNFMEVSLLKEAWIRDGLTHLPERSVNTQKNTASPNDKIDGRKVERPPSSNSNRRSVTPSRARSSSPMPTRPLSPITALARSSSPARGRMLSASSSNESSITSMELDRMALDLTVAWQTGKEVAAELRWLRRQFIDNHRHFDQIIKKKDEDTAFNNAHMTRIYEQQLAQIKQQARRDIKTAVEHTLRQQKSDKG